SAGCRKGKHSNADDTDQRWAAVGFDRAHVDIRSADERSLESLGPGDVDVLLGPEEVLPEREAGFAGGPSRTRVLWSEAAGVHFRQRGVLGEAPEQKGLGSALPAGLLAGGDGS